MLNRNLRNTSWALIVAACVWVSLVQAAEPARPDLSGTWTLDFTRSDRPDRMDGPPPGMGRGGPGGPPGAEGPPRGGKDGGPPGDRGGPPPGGEGGPNRRGRGPAGGLPNRMHIIQTAQVVSFEDSAGAVFREITTGAPNAGGPPAPGAGTLRGKWKGQKLEVRRPGPADAEVVETYALEDNGKRLVIRTELPGRGEMPARTIKRVYRRVGP